MLAAAAVVLSSLRPGDFDLRWIGAIHAVLYLLAIYLLLPVLADVFELRARMGILVAIALLLCDVMYVSVFNSFYMDAAAMVFLALTLVFFLRSVLWRRLPDLIGLAISCSLLSVAKPQHALLAIPVAILLIAWRKRVASPALAWLAVAGTVAGGLWTAVSVPFDYRGNQWYDVVFLGLLPYSPAPAADLAELGLDPADVRYSQTSAYFSGGGFANPEFTARFRSRVGARVLVRFYLRHPFRTLQYLLRSFDDAGNTRPADLGNFDPAEGRPPFAQARSFAWWSGFRHWLFAGHGLRYFLFTVGLAMLLLARVKPNWRLAAVCLTIALLLEGVVSGLADAAEAPRHFTLFALLEDAGLIVLLATFLPKKA